jgi:hypothetical protein
MPLCALFLLWQFDWWNAQFRSEADDIDTNFNQERPKQKRAQHYNIIVSRNKDASDYFTFSKTICTVVVKSLLSDILMCQIGRKESCVGERLSVKEKGSRECFASDFS